MLHAIERDAVKEYRAGANGSSIRPLTDDILAKAVHEVHYDSQKSAAAISKIYSEVYTNMGRKAAAQTHSTKRTKTTSVTSEPK